MVYAYILPLWLSWTSRLVANLSVLCVSADVLFRLGIQQLRTGGLLSEYKLYAVNSLTGHQDELSQKVSCCNLVPRLSLLLAP